MQTHPIEFGRRHVHAAHSHLHGQKQHLGNKFFTSHARSTGDTHHDQLVKQTQKWVSQTFFGELLKQMRNSPFKSKVLSGGRGGEAFTEMFDQKLADKIAKGSGRKLVDAIVNKIEAKSAYSKMSHPKAEHQSKRPRLNSALLTGRGGVA